MPYLGKTPSQATRQRYYKTASGGETSLSGTMTVGGTLTFNDGEFVDVSVNGVALVAGTDYNTTTANTIGGLSALSANDQVEIVVYDTFSVFSGDVDSNLSVGGNLSVTGTTALTGAATLTAGFTASDGCTITTADNTAQLTLTSTDADGSVGPILVMHRNSSSPADNDLMGQILFNGEDDGSNEQEYARIEVTGRDVTDGTEDGQIDIKTLVAGSVRSRMVMNEVETVFNQDSQDIDFRVESDGNANMLVVDAGNNRVGIGNGSPSHLLDATVSSDSATARFGTTDNSGNNHGTVIISNGGTGDAMLRFDYEGSNTDRARIGITASGQDLGFYTSGNNERVRFDGSGSALFGGDLNTSLANNGSGFIVSSGHHYLKVANTESTSTNSTVYINRQSSDGDLISFRHANSTEGKISVSGTTVTYAGGHLARWSRLSDNSKPTTLLKGTVMTNLDAMLEWGDEDNEQHNHTAISSVEGDPNVAGVFVSWDSEDDYNDFYLGMTGDMVIRIAQGTTVERGNLLMIVTGKQMK